MKTILKNIFDKFLNNSFLKKNWCIEYTDKITIEILNKKSLIILRKINIGE